MFKHPLDHASDSTSPRRRYLVGTNEGSSDCARVIYSAVQFFRLVQDERGLPEKHARDAAVLQFVPSGYHTVKLLFICHRLPFPPNRGGKIRPFQMIQHLSKTHEVTVASLAHTAQELRDGSPLQQHCAQLIAEVVPDAARWTNAALSLPGTFPSSAAYFRSSRLAERIQDAWRNSAYDGIIVHCAFAAQYALPLQGGFRVMDYGDLDSAKWADYAHHRAFPLAAAYALESAKLRRFEKLVAQSSTHCTFTTRGECDSFRQLGISRPLSVIPNGVDAGFFCRDKVPPTDSKVIVFLGRMDYFPNIDGICWFEIGRASCR